MITVWPVLLHGVDRGALEQVLFALSVALRLDVLAERRRRRR